MTTDPSRLHPGVARITDSGTSAQPPTLALKFARGAPGAPAVPVLVLEEHANIEGLRASIRVHLPGHLASINGRSVRLDLGEREINLFDLRRVVHLLKQEYAVEVTGLYVRAGVIHRFAEHELKLKLFPNDGARTEEGPPRPMDEARDPAPGAPADELDELATEELEAMDEEPPPPAVLVPAPRSALAAVTLPHDLQPEDLADQPPAAAPRPVAPPAAITSPPLRPAELGSRTLTLQRTLRSGAIVRHDGDVVVFGDVNPGAQIVATGNITVLGALKGTAHAGCDGDERAFVLAFDLRATQIRIGPRIAVPTGRGQGAEVALVSGDDIVVEPYKAGRLTGRHHDSPADGGATGATAAPRAARGR